MVHLVFIHGINNQKRYPSDIQEIWWDQLVEGWKKHDHGPIPQKPKITVAYYAQRLYAACHGKPYLTDDPNGELPPLDLKSIVKMGESTLNTSGDGVEFLREYAKANNIVLPNEEIQQQGSFRRNLIKLGDWLAKRLPDDFSKDIAGQFLGQAAVYCDSLGLRNGIERQVMQLISGQSDPMEPITSFGSEPIIIVTHSLGSVVGFRMLLSGAFNRAQIPLFVTLGSPLSAEFIQKSLNQDPLRFPRPHVENWVNIYDREDVVTLGNSLMEKEIGFPGVENYPTKEYKKGDGRHGIGPHLRTYEASKAIFNALNA